MKTKAKAENSGSTERKRAYIGRRCKQCRNELKLTQEYLVEKTGAENQATISNLENKGMIGDFFWNYLEFLYDQGYNPSWIVIKENSNIPKKLAKQQGVRYLKDEVKKMMISTGKAVEILVNIQNNLGEIIDIPAGQENQNNI